jgi:hypothetical protein
MLNTASLHSRLHIAHAALPRARYHAILARAEPLSTRAGYRRHAPERKPLDRARTVRGPCAERARFPQATCTCDARCPAHALPTVRCPPPPASSRRRLDLDDPPLAAAAYPPHLAAASPPPPPTHRRAAVAPRPPTPALVLPPACPQANQHRAASTPPPHSSMPSYAATPPASPPAPVRARPPVREEG